jgi:hypothetical protein
MQLTDYERDALNRFGKSVQDRKWSNDGLVQLIELAGSFLNLATITDYATQKGLTYNGVKKCRNIIKLFNVKFVIDNL